MTKADLVEQVAQDVVVTRKEAGEVVDAALTSILEALRRGEKVEIRGFGTFRTRTRNARTGRNPRSGDRVEVPAKTVPYFKPSKQLLEAVSAANQTDG